MFAAVADIADIDRHVVSGLPLHIEGPVFRIRQLVIDIVVADDDGTIGSAVQQS